MLLLVIVPGSEESTNGPVMEVGCGACRLWRCFREAPQYINFFVRTPGPHNVFRRTKAANRVTVPRQGSGQPGAVCIEQIE